MQAWTTPFDREPRPDTGLTNGQLGLALGIAAQLMLLGALVASYVLLEVGAAPGAWPAVGQRGAHPLMPWVQAVLPVSLAVFGTVSHTGPIANAAAGGPAAMVMAWGMAVGPAAGAVPWLAWLLHLPTVVGTWWVEQVAHVAAAAPVLPAVLGQVALAVLVVRRPVAPPDR